MLDTYYPCSGYPLYFSITNK